MPRKNHTSRSATTSRGRLTPVDVVFYGVAIFCLAIFAEPIYTLLNSNAGSLQTGEAYMFQLIFPALIGTIMTVVLLTGASGGN